MLDANLKAQLQSYLEQLTQPIELVASLDDSAKSRELLALLQDDRRAVRPRSRVIEARRRRDRTPSFAINRAGTDVGVALRRPPDGPRVHLAGAGAAAGRRPPAQGRRRA